MGWTDALTKEEKTFIKKNYASMTISEIALSLGRSYFTVQKYSHSINLGTYHKWSAEEDAILLALWGKRTAGDIANVIGVDVNCVYNRVRRMRRNGKLNGLGEIREERA